MAWTVTYTRSGPNSHPTTKRFESFRYWPAFAVYLAWSVHYAFSNAPYKTLSLTRREGNRIALPFKLRSRNGRALRMQLADRQVAKRRSVFSVDRED